MNKYIYKPYDKRYPNLFKKEEKEIIHALGKNILIEHVGSTSVPGLGGKGIIDIAILTPKNKLKLYLSKLNNLGFEYVPSHKPDSRRVFMQKIITYKGKERRVHVHLCLTKTFFNSFILFRDYLKRNAKEKDEYAEIKREGVKLAKGDAKKYRAHKEEFIVNLMKKALNSDSLKPLYPSNTAHFKKLLPFAQKIIKICQENRIEPVIYGSFAHFYHTKDTNMKVNDIDLLIPQSGLKKLKGLLHKSKVKFEMCSPEGDSMIARKGSVKVELDDVGTGYKTLNEKALTKDIFEKIDFYGLPVNMITLEHIKEIYPVAYNRSVEDKVKILKKIRHLENFLGKKLI